MLTRPRRIWGVVPFNPVSDFIVMESQMKEVANEALRRLIEYPIRSKRARQSANRWFCSGSPLSLPDGNPSCLLLDLGLTLYKQRLGFRQGVNILPEPYASEQRSLKRLIAKAMPEFSLEVVLYDLAGKYRVLD